MDGAEISAGGNSGIGSGFAERIESPCRSMERPLPSHDRTVAFSNLIC
jgi:hypothetical protein